MAQQQSLVQYLEDELPSWSNPHDVQLYLNTDSTLGLFAPWPGMAQTGNIRLELTREFDSLDHFLKEMKLSRVEQLQQLRPADLLEGFALGRINILCSLDGPVDRELRFRKQDGKIWATDTSLQRHEVRVRLHKPEDYIAYTIGYYQVLHN